MKNCILFIFCFTFFSVYADGLPKDCIGHYAGEMPAYRVAKNDIEMNIEKQDVHVQISSTHIYYKSGSLQLKGTYTYLKQSSSQILINADLSNGKNVSYKVDLVWDKKKSTLYLAGKNGEPDITLEKLDN